MKFTQQVIVSLIASVVLIACSEPNTLEKMEIDQVAKNIQTTNQSNPEGITQQDQSCQFTIGFDIWEPYQYIGRGKKIQGLDIELVQMIAEQMDCSLNYHQGSWGQILGLLKSGEVDLILGASITEERKTYALFSEAYRSEEFLLYVRADEEFQHRQATVMDFVMEMNKIGVIGEYYYGSELSTLMDNQQYAHLFQPAFMSEINLARLLDGGIDGFLEDSFVGASMVRRKGLTQYITPHQAKINTGNVYVMFSRITVKPQMVMAFNQALDILKNNGYYDNLVSKYSQ